jgi:hypothetical protein
MLPILQACQQYDALLNYWTSGQFFDAIYCAFGGEGVLGPVFPLFIAAALGTSLFVYGGSVVLPLVVLMLVGSAIVPFLPGTALRVVVMALVLGLGVVGFGIVLRLEGRTA